MKKGDKVKILKKAFCVHYGMPPTSRELRTDISEHKTGIIIGYSFLRTGEIRRDYSFYDEPSQLYPIKDHKVWVVEPLDNGNRYIKPLRCFEEDLELITEE